MATTTLTTEALAHIVAFEGLPTDVLQWLLDHGEIRHFASGNTIFQPGDPAEFMVAVLAGGLQFFALRNGNREPLFRVDTRQISGVLPYSRLRIIQGLALAVGDTTLFLLHRDRFSALEQISPELIQRLVALMNDRARQETRGQERDDKLRALGKLSAGLAHELNNPAAAIVRAAEALDNRLRAKPGLLQELVRHCPDPAALADLAAVASATPALPPAMSSLDRSDREDELSDWLETQGVPDGYALASGLMAAGLTLPQLMPLIEALPEPSRPSALAWLEGQLTTLCLVRDVQEAGNRISTLVSNVKTYSHMDRAGDFSPLNIQDGLESTINIFNYSLRDKKITLTRDYASHLPLVKGQVSSLNQVWTNLLDNAIDALAAGGEIILRTRLDGDFVRVFVIDNGPGIPPDVLPHILEPFYTTKAAGEGTGLGLDIALRIVEQHDGRLEAQSEPGHTEFCVWLPVAGSR